jgi:hypothetical protein
MHWPELVPQPPDKTVASSAVLPIHSTPSPHCVDDDEQTVDIVRSAVRDAFGVSRLSFGGDSADSPIKKAARSLANDGAATCSSQGEAYML